MANDYVEKIDLDGEQWDLKDGPLSEQVSRLQVYSTTEINTGKKWIDDKPIYRKVIDFGALPNAASKTVVCGIQNLDTMVTLRGCTASSTDIFPLPHVHLTLSSAIMLYYIRSTDRIVVQTGSNRTSFTNTKIIMEYTKTTD